MWGPWWVSHSNNFWVPAGLTGIRFINNTIELWHFPGTECLCQCGLFFWRKNNIGDSELNRDQYLCLIWYLYKTWNNKLIRRHGSLRIDHACERRVSKLVLSKYDCFYDITANKQHQFKIHMLGEHMFSGWIMDFHLLVQWLRMS